MRSAFENKTRIALAGNPGGICFLKLFNDQETIVRKIVLIK
jgi:hypothetical protein